MKNFRLKLVLVVIVSVLALAGSNLPRALAAGGPTISNQDFPACQNFEQGCANQGNCPYCDQEQCGCATFPGKTLAFSCSCSSIWCQRSCDYS